MIVIDANVAAKWFVPEPGSAAALELVEQRETLIAPDLIKIEVLAAITKRVRRGEWSAEKTLASCQEWHDCLRRNTITLYSNDELLTQATDLSVTLQQSIQDCLYLALALQNDADLWTADEPFFKWARDNFPRIALLPGCHAN